MIDLDKWIFDHHQAGQAFDEDIVDNGRRFMNWRGRF
jgi:hypothetical protein